MNAAAARALLLAAAFGSFAKPQPASPPPVTFVDIAKSVGIAFKHEASPTAQKYLIETMGGGVALFDFDNDGRLDIFCTNGARLADPMPAGQHPDKSNPRFWNRLYRQKPGGIFEDVTERAGLSGSASSGKAAYAMGVAAADYDNDGFTDLYVTAFGANTLYRNNGDGTFTDVTARAGVAASGWSSSAGFFDYDNDGRLDLFVGRYLDFTFATNRYCGEGRPGGRAYCHPDNYRPAINLLYRNNGDGTFTDVSTRAGIANPNGKTLGVAFADYDGDGWTDIYVANDSVQCFLFRNTGRGAFEEVSLAAGVGFNENGRTFAGMGTDFADYNNDGLADIIVTDLSDERYVLYRNNGDATFTDATTESGIGRATNAYSGWSTRFFDYDNDGWKDLFVAQGHVMDTIESTSIRKYLQPPLLLVNRAGRFAPAPNPGAIFNSAWAGRGAAFGDLDNDGDIDVVVSNVNQPAYVLRNEGGHRNGWIALRPAGRRANRDAIGARIKVTLPSGLVQHYAVSTAVGYQSASDKRIVVGLAGEKEARRVELVWPGGAVQRLEAVKSGTTLTPVEPGP